MTSLRKNGIKVVLVWLLYFVLLQYAHEECSFIINLIISLFVSPFILTYVFSYFFIQRVQPLKISEHSQVTRRYFLPVFIANLSRWLGYFLIGTVSRVWLYSLDEYLIGCFFSDFIYSFYLVWIIEAMFEKGDIWKALRSPAASGPLFIVVYFIVSIFNIGLDLLAEDYVKQNAALVFSTYCLSAGSYLLFVKFFINRRALQFKEGLGNLISEDAANNEIERNEKLEIKNGQTALVLGFFSFVPLVHIFAAYLGWMRFRKQKAGRIRALCGSILGIFFTLMYLITILGSWVSWHRNINQAAPISTIERYLQADTASKEMRTAWGLINDGELEEAISILEKTNSIPDEIKAFALGLAYDYSVDRKKAIDMFLKCAKIEQHNGEAFFHLGVLSLSDEEHKAKARDYFSEYLKRFPADKRAKTYLELINNSVDSKNSIIIGIFSLMILWISFSFHEFAHAYAAYKCGDDSQKESGRLTLNPVNHLDIWGSIILPAILIFRHSDIVFGWAKPVYVNNEKFRNKDKDDAFVSFSGPCVNLLLALCATVLLALLGLVLSIVFPEMRTLNYFIPFEATSFVGIPFPIVWVYVKIFLLQFIILNITLFIFNLLPFPPLDGSSLFAYIVPARFKNKYEALRKYSLVFLIVLIATPLTDYLLGIPLSLYFIFLVHVVGRGLGLG